MTPRFSNRLPASRTYGRIMLAALFLLAALVFPAGAQQGYQKPPQPVLDVLNAPVPPQGVISPARDYMLLVQGVRYPPISELAQPMLRLAGLRINPNTTGPHRENYFVAMSLKKVADGPRHRALVGRRRRRPRAEAQKHRGRRRLRHARPVDARQPHAARADRPGEARHSARRGRDAERAER